MESTPSAPLDVALAYHRAWTSGDVGAALDYVADSVTCSAPGVELSGKPDFAQFLAPFAARLLGQRLLASFGDATSAVLVYQLRVPGVDEAPATELFAVRDGRIVNDLLIFDRQSFAPPPV